MIVRITTHGRTKGVVLAHTPPDLAHAMGMFQPARWSAKANAYLLGEEHLETFARHLARHDAQLVDERDVVGADNEREKFTGPLPECAECGQPAGRKVSLSLRFCPACGKPWQPAALAQTGPAAIAKSECGSCGRAQAGAFTRCSACGGSMVQRVTGARPAHVPRPKLADPVLFGEVVEDLADELEPDHTQRAAGER